MRMGRFRQPKTWLVLGLICTSVVLLNITYSKNNALPQIIKTPEMFSAKSGTKHFIPKRRMYMVEDRNENQSQNKTTWSRRQKQSSERKGVFTETDYKYYKNYLRYKDMASLCQTLPDLSKSTAKIIKNNGSRFFNVRDKIKVKIDLYNIYGQHITRGGDFIKIWMRESDRDAGSAGYIIDYDNGTYVGVLRALWSGFPSIKISLSFPKEAIGLFVNNIFKNQMVFKIDGVFKNSFGETSLGSCGINPRSQGTNGCNFTAQNHGMRWFCSVPNSKEFGCDDWYAIKADMSSTFTNTELTFLRSNSNKLLQQIQIEVKGDKIYQHTNMPCEQLRPSDTWKNVSPIGFIYENKWQSLSCMDDLPKNRNTYKVCLGKREILMIGDSSLRMWFVALVKILDLKLTTGEQYILEGHPWHRLAEARSNSQMMDGISLKWMPHELPFFSSADDAVIDNYKSASFYLSKITSERPIIILHWYLHLAALPVSVFKEHVQNAKNAIVLFLKRIPKATIFIKGPHNIDIPRNKGIPHDFVRFYQEDILFQEFKELQDSVYFLNEWDITVASESKDTHPIEELNIQMVHNFLTLIC